MKETNKQILKRIKHSEEDFKELEPIAQEAVEALRLVGSENLNTLTASEVTEFEGMVDGCVKSIRSMH